MKRLLGTLLAVGSLAAAGCGSSSPDPTPNACLGGGDAYLAALVGAPDAVALGESVPISDCLVGDQSAGQLSAVGEGMIAAASELNRRARIRPGGAAAEQLGYLLGAVEEGASETAGIHSDLVLRLNAAARFSPGGAGLGAEFERTYGSGYAAARGLG